MGAYPLGKSARNPLERKLHVTGLSGTLNFQIELVDDKGTVDWLKPESVDLSNNMAGVDIPTTSTAPEPTEEEKLKAVMLKKIEEAVVEYITKTKK